MKRQQSQSQMDEHDQPTEPMMPVFPAPSASTIADNNLPVAIPSEQPFPYQQALNTYPPYTSEVAPNVPVYPVLPLHPGSKKRGAVSPVAADSASQVTAPQSKRSSFPLMVGMFFVAVQLLLLIRFVLKLLMFSANIPWIGVLYTISSIFIWPFRVLLQNLPLALPNSIELYTLLAILLYGLLSRLLVRFLKALFRSH